MGDGGLVGRELNVVDWIGLFVCFAIGSGVADAVGRRLDPATDFWPAFGIKVAAGGAVGVAAVAVWLGVIRRKS